MVVQNERSASGADGLDEGLVDGCLGVAPGEVQVVLEVAGFAFQQVAVVAAQFGVDARCKTACTLRG